jgi:hypothetical protein
MKSEKHDSAAVVGTGMAPHVRLVSMPKGEHRWLCRYRAGREDDLIRSLAETAAEANHGFDWHDAGALIYLLGRTNAVSRVQRSRRPCGAAYSPGTRWFGIGSGA